MNKKPINPTIAGETVVFEWAGPRAPQLIGDFNNWNGMKAITLAPAGRENWRCSLNLPAGAYIEYVYLLDGKRVLDPRNPQKTYNGINAYNNYFYMPGAGPTPLMRKARNTPQGTLKRVTIPGRYSLGGEDRGINLFQREVVFYQPPVSEPVPLLVVYDGLDYLKRASLPRIVDNLIAQKQIRPLALALVANGKQNRFLEYACSDVTLGFLLFNLLPVARRELRLLDVEKQPGAYGVMGASMGGLMALYTGLRHVEIFGKVLSQSGAFYPKFVVNTLIEAGLGKAVTIWQDVGNLEYLLSFNRQMAGLLQERGYTAAYHEYCGGHNYTAWRDELPAGLEYLFGG